MLAGPVALAVLLGVSGCGEKELPSDQDVLIVVGAHRLTMGDLLRRLEMHSTLRAHTDASFKGKKAGRFREKLMAGYPAAFALNAMLVDYAADEKVEVTSDLLKEYENKAFKRFHARGDKDYADLRRKLGDSGKELDAQVYEEALGKAIKDHLVKLNPTNIPDSYVDRQLANFKLYNENAAKTNALIYAQATNVWRQLCAGADFREMAAKHSHLEDERESKGFWGAIDVNQMGDEPNIQKWGRKLEVGKFSPPIEADNGLMIMRVDERLDNGNELHLSRIFFMLPEFRHPAPRDQILAAAYDKYADRLFARKCAELRRKVAPVVNEFKQKRQDRKQENKQDKKGNK